MEQPCPTCGSQNPSDLNFCIYCGSKLEGLSAKVPQFRFPSMRSLVSDKTATTAYNTWPDVGETDKAAYNFSPVVDNIDKQEYNVPAASNRDNVTYDLPAGWVSSNTGYNLPVSGIAGSIVYDTLASADNAQMRENNLSTSSGLAENSGNDFSASAEGVQAVGYNVPADIDRASHSAYHVSVEAGFSAEKNSPSQVRLVQRDSPPGAALPGSLFSSIQGRLPRYAFAGRGSRITHHSWLLHGQYLYAGKLHEAVINFLKRRNLQKLDVRVEKLQEHGYGEEERDYMVMQQGIISIFLYIAPVGQDLYLSRTTTVQPPLNPLRIFLLIVALGEFLAGPSVLSHLLTTLMMHKIVGSGITLIIDITSVILLIPAVLFLVTFLLASFRQWFIEKDFWVYLRRNTLNDFEIDDIMLLEQVTDDAVRAATGQLNLDATRITAPVTGYQPRRRIRTV